MPRPLLLALLLSAACTVRNVSSDPHGNKISMPFQWSIKSSDAFHLTAGPNSGDAALHLESLPAGVSCPAAFARARAGLRAAGIPAFEWLPPRVWRQVSGGTPDQWVSGAQYPGGLGAGFCETTPAATSIVALAARPAAWNQLRQPLYEAAASFTRHGKPQNVGPLAALEPDGRPRPEND